MSSPLQTEDSPAFPLPKGTVAAALCLGFGAFLAFTALVLFYGHAGGNLVQGMEDRLGDIAWRQGIRFEKAGQHENAMGSYRLALEGRFQSPLDRTDALMRLGRILWFRQGPEAALPLLEEAYARPGHTPWLYEPLCSSLHGVGRYEEALQVTRRWQEATDLPPDYRAKAWYYEGLALRDLGQADQALETFMQGAEVSPGGRCDYEVAMTLYTQKRLREALPYVERYVARNTDARTEHLKNIRARILAEPDQ
ncbi:MAG: tetratricopeptide repeat protein [bacterium]|nr:tetratricopeptide repeat protein [bacterium]